MLNSKALLLLQNDNRHWTLPLEQKIVLECSIFSIRRLRSQETDPMGISVSAVIKKHCALWINHRFIYCSILLLPSISSSIFVPFCPFHSFFFCSPPPAACPLSWSSAAAEALTVLQALMNSKLPPCEMCTEQGFHVLYNETNSSGHHSIVVNLVIKGQTDLSKMAKNMFNLAMKSLDIQTGNKRKWRRQQSLLR